MEVKIEVSDEQFQTLVQKSIEDLPKEKMQEILLETMRQYLTEKDIWEKLLIEKTSSGWNSKDVPSNFLREIIKHDGESDTAIAEIRTEMLEHLKKNSEEVLRKAIGDMILKKLFGSNEFYEAAYNAASMSLHEIKLMEK